MEALEWKIQVCTIQLLAPDFDNLFLRYIVHKVVVCEGIIMEKSNENYVVFYERAGDEGLVQDADRHRIVVKS